MTTHVIQAQAKFQIGQLALITSQAKITVASAGVRGGKTHAGAFRSILYAMTHPTREDQCHGIGSPTYPMSKVPIAKIWRLLADKTLFPISPLIKYIKSERAFMLRTVSGEQTKLQAVSLHDPNRVRGMEFLSAWLDEGAYLSKEAWDIVLGRCADNDAPIWITTTPDGYNFVHDLYEQAVAEKKAGVPLEDREIRFINWGSYDNPWISEKGVLRLERAYDSRTHAQEVQGKFVKPAGRIYHGFSARNIKPWALRRNELIFVGQDFNVASMSTVFMQRTKSGDGLHIFAEREILTISDTYTLCAFLDSWCASHGIPKGQIRVIPDASGSSNRTSGKSDHKILREGGYKIISPKRNPFVKDRINCVNGMFSPRSGEPRLFVDPSCQKSIRSVDKQLWDTSVSPPAPDKTMGYDHLPDAIGYPCWALFPLQISAHLGGSYGSN